MGYILGLDLGITSVGFGIIEEDTYKIIKYGVRLFDEGTADNNLKRRQNRSSRRLKSRRKNRINAIKYLLLNNNVIPNVNFDILVALSTKSNTSLSTFTGEIPAFWFTFEIWEVGIQADIKFSIRFTSAIAKSENKFPWTESFATTVISKGLPNKLCFFLKICCPNESVCVAKSKRINSFFIFSQMRESFLCILLEKRF